MTVDTPGDEPPPHVATRSGREPGTLTAATDRTADEAPPTPRATWQAARPVPPRELAHVAVADHGGVTVAAISGEIDMSSVERVATALTDLSNLAMGLVVDLSSVHYMDSSGISLLHDLALRLRRRTQLLIIVCPADSPPRRMLELTALDAQAVVLDELEPAIEAVSSADADPGAGDV